MSFRNKWIEDNEAWLRRAEKTVGSIPVEEQLSSLADSARFEMATLQQTLDEITSSAQIKIPDHQLQEFLNIALSEDQDFKLLRGPFPSLYMDVVPALMYPNFYDTINNEVQKEVKICGIMIIEHPVPTDMDVRLSVGRDGSKHISQNHVKLNLERFWKLTVFIPLLEGAENTFHISFGVDHEGNLVLPTLDMFHADAKAAVRRFVDMAVHIMNYLTSPSIILDKKEHSPKLQRARAKRKKEPLPDWYEIRYAKTRREVGETGEGSKHSFRYDVRGHWMNVRKGRLAGRVFWIPAHQRGIANAVYKPKTYTLEKETR